MNLDTSFDFRTDCPVGQDPDRASPLLRRYHRALWSKVLPDGRSLDLRDDRDGIYLYHRSEEVGELHLASDSVIQTFIRWARLRPIIDEMDPADNDAFMSASYTIGGMMVFPGNKVDGAMTINGARGLLIRIADRMDLTLECIRRHYLGDDATPLGQVLRRYDDFFRLFGSFAGYVDFFLLDDLVVDGRVQFFLPFDGFGRPAHPTDVAAYREFRLRSLGFVAARNERIGRIGVGRVVPVHADLQHRR